MIDFTSWYFVLKHFKLQQFNTISVFLFFIQSDPMSSTYLDYLKYRYKGNKLSKIMLVLPNFPKSEHLFLADKFFCTNRVH